MGRTQPLDESRVSIHVPRYSRSATAHSVRYPRVRLPREDRTEDMHEKGDPALVAMLQGPGCADSKNRSTER